MKNPNKEKLIDIPAIINVTIIALTKACAMIPASLIPNIVDEFNISRSKVERLLNINTMTNTRTKNIPLVKAVEIILLILSFKMKPEMALMITQTITKNAQKVAI
jgi:hypothetical protein